MKLSAPSLRGVTAKCDLEGSQSAGQPSDASTWVFSGQPRCTITGFAQCPPTGDREGNIPEDDGDAILDMVLVMARLRGGLLPTAGSLLEAK